MSWFGSWIRYRLERAVLRGSFSLVVLLILVQALIAFGGAAIAYFLPGHYFPTFQKALWWAVLRISDPGYLSDDIPHLSIRILSAALSVLGMAVTVGGIVAIVTQWMNLALQRLAAATTPVPFRDHFVVIGWSDRTLRLLSELLKETNGRIVLLLERVTPENLRQINRRIQKLTHLDRIVLRAGSPYRPNELARAACQGAKAVILPASLRAVAGDRAEGPMVLKCLLALRTLFEREGDGRTPIVVVELVDRGLLPLVQSTLPNVRVLPSDRIVARVMRLSLQGRSLVDLALDVARPDQGLRVHTHHDDAFLGQNLLSIATQIEGGHAMGVIRGFHQGLLIVDEEVVYRKGDRLLVLSPGVLSSRPPQPTPQGSVRPVRIAESRPLKILILGWNEAAADLIAELSLEPKGRYEIDLLSLVDQEEMRQDIVELVGKDCPVALRYFQGDPMDVDRRSDLQLYDYDRFVVLADRTVGADLADVRTLAVAVELQRLSGQLRRNAYLLLELLDQENSEVVGDVESITTPLLSGDVLTSLACSDEAAELLSLRFKQQLWYVTRVLHVRREDVRDELNLRRALLQRGFAYLYSLPAESYASDVPVLVVEPTQNRHTRKRPAEEPKASPA